MNNVILKTNHLSKMYKEQKALEKVDMTVEKGAIYGFIGQNGAGKSTLIRLVAGLAFPTEGSIELFGKSDAESLVQARKRMGTIIEGPALYPNMSASENLEAQRLLKGIPGKRIVAKTLEIVGLQDTGKKKAKNFSLGMKQRLGLAIALLNEPDFLILDEPINGLDPMGVIEIRELLKRLNRDYGITILISSHILAELHLLATDYGIIHKGELIEQLKVDELNEKCQQFLHIKVDKVNLAAAIIEKELATSNFEVMPNGTVRLYEHLDEPGAVSQILMNGGLVIEEFMPMGEDLEGYFMNRIGGAERG